MSANFAVVFFPNRTSNLVPTPAFLTDVEVGCTMMVSSKVLFTESERDREMKASLVTGTSVLNEEAFEISPTNREEDDNDDVPRTGSTLSLENRVPTVASEFDVKTKVRPKKQYLLKRKSCPVKYSSSQPRFNLVNNRTT
ncbi:hypothetical protein Aduo_005663 [Ancylostoma duodenale]